MKTYRNIKLTRKTLTAHKVRTGLAITGIAVGVAAVIIMTAVGQGARGEVLGQIEQMGSDLISVRAGKVKTIVGRKRQVNNVTTLKLNDYSAIRDNCPSVALAAPTQYRTFRVKYGQYFSIAEIWGTTEDFPVIRNYTIAKGRFFTPEENKASIRAAVIGGQIHEDLFDKRNPLGEIIRVGNVPFEIIGVLAPKGVSFDGANEDNKIFIPINTALRRVFNLDYIDTVFVRTRGNRYMDTAESEIRQLLRERHRLDRRALPDDFTIQNQVRTIRVEKAAADSFTLLITGIAAISLLLGGVGILAVMLLTVKERTSEIGIRVAIGARSRDILVQFLGEAVTLSIAGGLIGAVSGITGAWLIGTLTQWATVVSMEAVAISTLFSLFTGLFFGVYPARKASLLDPIDAINTE